MNLKGLSRISDSCVADMASIESRDKIDKFVKKLSLSLYDNGDLQVDLLADSVNEILMNVCGHDSSSFDFMTYANVLLQAFKDYEPSVSDLVVDYIKDFYSENYYMFSDKPEVEYDAPTSQFMLSDSLIQDDFKRGNKVQVTLSTGRVIEGIYQESYKSGKMHIIKSDGKEYGVPTKDIVPLHKSRDYSKQIASIKEQLLQLDSEEHDIINEQDHDPDVIKNYMNGNSEAVTKYSNKLKALDKKRSALQERLAKYQVNDSTSKFLEVLKSAVEKSDMLKDNEYYGVNLWTLTKFISNWPPKIKNKDDNDEEQDLDLENSELIKLTPSKLIFSANGDWQNTHIVEVGLKDNKLSVLNVYPSEKGTIKSILNGSKRTTPNEFFQMLGFNV